MVDDEEAELTLIKRILVEAGFSVVTAQSGFECLELFRMHPHQFALVLLDLTLPFMDGEETFRRLREIRHDRSGGALHRLCSARSLEHMMNCGLSGFLRKPIPPDEIVGLVRSILDNAKYSREVLIPGEFTEAV